MAQWFRCSRCLLCFPDSLNAQVESGLLVCGSCHEKTAKKDNPVHEELKRSFGLEVNKNTIPK